ncbi:NACHT domain-containing NTPase [Nocardiopsis gilva]|uniref:NACHT domain-containing protein n=1 Tax=Nocardiopsis gilva TaxID=280236 RepID=UPI00034BA32B|nr:hypothetical protein [Nocardiopsis gilva]
MAKRLSYADALKILGKDDSAVLDFAEQAADGALSVVGIPDLFGAGGAVVKHGRKLLTSVRERINGVGRLDRTQRITAAHTVLVIVAYFEAVEECLAEQDSPLTLNDLELTADEQVRLAGVSEDLLDGQHVPFPEAHGEFEINQLLLEEFYDLSLRSALYQFLTGLACWEALSTTDKGRLARILHTCVPGRALRRYAEGYRQLAVDVPEFGVWSMMREHQRTRARLDTGLAGLRDLLADMTTGATPGKQCAALSRRYAKALERPVLAADDAPADFTLPSLGKAYINPRGRVGRAVANSQPSTEEWVNDHPVIDDLQGVIAGTLTGPSAVTHPIVVLGQPGSGKSKLTQVLAARLPAADFLPVLVELRSVTADAPLQDQIEEGIYATIGERVSWPDLVRSAGDALPVVILDGFDELLQATGASQSDYLEQVRLFQEREAELDRPTAVIVTTRTAVANRARIPDGSLIVRLEPFDDHQIDRMIEVWNHANQDALERRGLRRLSAQTVLRYRDLAEQPLLLMMLLIYDADENALQRTDTEGAAMSDGRAYSGSSVPPPASSSRDQIAPGNPYSSGGGPTPPGRVEAGAGSKGELYEQLLTSFARREVRKHQPHLDDGGMEHAVDLELRRLEIVAVAMFTRRRQTVTADELNSDLSVLIPEMHVDARGTDLSGSVSDAHQVFGRFFFVHESQAQRDARTDSVYEFLHSTFGEFLVARHVTATLHDLVIDRANARRRRFSTPLDDGLLYAITSFAALSGRQAIVEFLGDIFERRFAQEPEERTEYRSLLLELFHEAPFPQPNRSFTDYAPVRLPIVTRQSTYTANLVLLLVLGGTKIAAAELFPDSQNPWKDWRVVANQWRGIVDHEWHGLVDVIRVRHDYTWRGEGSTHLELERGDDVNVGECIGFEIKANPFKGSAAVTDPYRITLAFEGVTSSLLRAAALRANGTAARTFLMLGPYLTHVSSDMLTWYTEFDASQDDAVWGELHDVMELRLAPLGDGSEERLRRYSRLLDTRWLGRLELLVLRQAAEDLRIGRASGTDPSYMADLSSEVWSYLGRVRKVVYGKRLSPKAVRPVLDALEPFFSEFLDELSHAPQQVFEGILGLAEANSPSEPDPEWHYTSSSGASGPGAPPSREAPADRAPLTGPREDQRRRSSVVGSSHPPQNSAG